MSTFVIVVAGGKGRRVGGGENKCLLPLCGKEMLVWTFEAFANSKIVDAGVCVLGTDEEVSHSKALLKRHSLDSFVRLVIPTGGEQRQDGCRTGLEALSILEAQKEDLVMFHNGANPLVKTSDIRAARDAALRHGASVCARPVVDTVKSVDENLFVKDTLKRSELWAMQTPQTIRYDLAREAFEAAATENFYGTDDVQLVERIGGKVKVVECSEDNFKITTPRDVARAEQLLGG